MHGRVYGSPIPCGLGARRTAKKNLFFSNGAQTSRELRTKDADINICVRSNLPPKNQI